MTQEETDINDLAKAVDDAMPKKGLVRVSPSYGICVYVPLKRKDGTIDMQAVEILCGIDSISGKRNLRIADTFVAMAELNNMDKSQLAKGLAQFARQIYSALMHASELFEKQEES
jgi:hypothetical protein